MVQQGIVLGHRVSEKGLEVDEAKIDLISNLRVPTTVKQVISFLSHAGLYRRFLKDFTKVARPLTRLLSNDTPFEFDRSHVEAL